MKYESETFFIGIIDLFSIMLPGALATSLVARRVEPYLFTDLFQPYASDGAKLAMFLFASYLLGHFIFLLGSFLDEFVYDKLRSQMRDEDVTLLKAIKKQFDEVNKDGKNRLLNEIANQVKVAIDAPKPEQQQMIEKLRKALEAINEQPQGIQEKVQLIAFKNIDKELRKYSYRQGSWLSRFKKWVLTQAFSKTPDIAVNRVLEIKKNYVPDVKGNVVVNAFQWAKALLAIKNPHGLAEVQRLEADSKFFRSLVIVLFFLVGWLLWKAVKGNPNWPVFTMCLFFSGLSFWRYVERRFKSTQQAYWYVITLEGCTLPGNEKL